jgi:hypothetical protein
MPLNQIKQAELHDNIMLIVTEIVEFVKIVWKVENVWQNGKVQWFYFYSAGQHELCKSHKWEYKSHENSCDYPFYTQPR